MNATVKRIVELLFEDAEPTDEVRALHDEVLNNCQERFDDLMYRGLNEDEAIEAVVESLKGMEEVIRRFPQKQNQRKAEDENDQKATEENTIDANGNGAFTFDPAKVRQLTAELADANLLVEPWKEACISLELHGCVGMEAYLDGDTLMIRKDKRTIYHSRHVEIGYSDDWEAKEKEANFGTMLGSFLHRMSSIFGTVGGGEVILRVPSEMILSVDLKSLSGDIVWHDVELTLLKVDSLSGDVHIRGTVNHARVKTTSGDIQMRVDCSSGELTSMSGDIDWQGSAGSITLKTTSGDITCQALCPETTIKSISGDIQCLTEGSIASQCMNTVSGDVRIVLPDAPESTGFSLHTVSGSIATKGRFSNYQPGDTVIVKTTSGDITICS